MTFYRMEQGHKGKRCIQRYTLEDGGNPGTKCGRIVHHKVSRAKNQPKEEVFGTDIPRMSGGHSRGYPGPKLRSGRSKPWKNMHVGADIHDPKARTSTTLRDFQKLRSEKLWAEFSFPKVELVRTPPYNKTLLSTSQMTYLIGASQFKSHMPLSDAFGHISCVDPTGNVEKHM